VSCIDRNTQAGRSMPTHGVSDMQLLVKRVHVGIVSR